MSTPVIQEPLSAVGGTRRRLERQRTHGGLCGSARILGTTPGFSTDSGTSVKSAAGLVVPISSSTPLLRHQVSGDGSASISLGTGGSISPHRPLPGSSSIQRSKLQREVFKWSGVTVSFDAESIKIENELNGGPPGLKTIGKEVTRFPSSASTKSIFTRQTDKERTHFQIGMEKKGKEIHGKGSEMLQLGRKEQNMGFLSAFLLLLPAAQESSMNSV